MGEHPELLGALGWVYKKWVPSRTEDARVHFKRAAELKCTNHETYWHWFEMEETNGNWLEVSECSRFALDVFPKNIVWTFRYGDSLSRYGQFLIRQFQPRGRVYLSRAQKTLKTLVDTLQVLVPFNPEFHSKVCRALTLNAADLYSGSTSDDEKGKYKASFSDALKNWHSKYGNDPEVDFECQNLLKKYPSITLTL